MILTQLEIQNVRNLTSEKLECGTGINLLLGANAAGKSAILEAIHFLSAARSFRTPRVREVIQYGKESLMVNARFRDKYQNTGSAGIEKGTGHTRIRFKGERVMRRSEQIQNVPVISIVPETLQVLTASPKMRRHWLDWALFHVEPRYFNHWHAYHQALRQRNALIRQGKIKDKLLNGWERAMVDNAGRLRQARFRYLEGLQDRLRDIIPDNRFAGTSLKLNTPDTDNNEFQQVLQEQRRSDARLGHTRTGPHRADVIISCDSRSAAETLSRGEGKRLMILLMVAQAVEYQQRKGQAPIIIIDDLAAELDSRAVGLVLDLLEMQGMQAFITATSAELLSEYSRRYTGFHVEHGKLQKMVN